jgi:hypothetical protein
MASGHNETAIFIEGSATDTLYLNPVPTPDTSPVPPGDDGFGIIYVSSGDVLSPVAGDPYYRKPNNGTTYDLLQAALISAATFITVVNEPTLPDSRLLSVSSDLGLSDTGPQGTIEITLSAANSAFLAGARNASFVTALTEAGLPQSRRLNGVASIAGGIAVTDNGAGSTIDVSLDAAAISNLNKLLFAPFLFPINDAVDFPISRQVTAGPGISIVDTGPGGTFSITAEQSTSVIITFVVTPVVGGTNPTPIHLQTWNFTKVGKRVTAIFYTLNTIDGGSLGASTVIAPAGSIPAGYEPAFDIEEVARFLGLTSLSFASTWGIGTNGSIFAAAVPSVGSQFLPGPGKGWVGCSLTWNTV